jgi:hypothetical protein
MKPKVSIVSTALFAAFAASVCGSAFAQSATPAQSLLEDKFVVNVGAFVMSSDLSGRLNGEAVTNPDVDFDKVFGRASDATRVRADALWRVTPNHHLRFMYFDNSTTRSRVLDQTLEWGDYSFQVGGKVELQNKLRIFELAYEYALLRSPDYEVSASLGVHYLDMSIRLSGAANVTDSNGNVTSVSAASSAKSVPAPLPVIGLRAGWAVSPQWYLDAQGQYFKASVDGYNGYISDLRVGATWMYSQNFGLGIGYNRFVTNVDVSRASFDGRLRVGYSGVQVYLTGAY